MNEKIKNVLTWSIIGDALGTTLDGMGKAHIRAVFGDISGYIDPSPALKGKMQKWRKPGLYSSISQMQILMAAITKGNAVDHKAFMELIRQAPENAETGTRIFRYPDPAESGLILSGMETGDRTGNSLTSARIIPLVIPSALKTKDPHTAALNAARIIKPATDDAMTVSGGMIMALLTASMGSNRASSPDNILHDSITVINEWLAAVEPSPHIFFEMGFNPDSLLTAAHHYRNAIDAVKEKKDTGDAEKVIVAAVNTTLKTPSTRATINHPLAILPFALFLLHNLHRDPESLLFRVVQEGGNSAALAAITGALAGCYFDSSIIPGILQQDMVNRKRIHLLIEDISSGKLPNELLLDFLQSEASLTAKMHQELKAKLKHQKEPVEKKKKAPHTREQELAKHVVESWTKIDRARYKKELRKKP
ncbi:MAG: hypothetical protein CVV44_18365 [Spirochaetae bacterium HGW-Spirochaetae-1]|jgi:ADP-ribosylglycohydrolase|nr:MAG: hypothetical protein CVV44_18365 [Spirochaetae bacterium HGW-Spirochaetae-1]